jgi:hypothetical protein
VARKSNNDRILFSFDLEVFFQYIFIPTLSGVGFLCSDHPKTMRVNPLFSQEEASCIDRFVT